jgi:hypothetical protein
MSLLLFLFAGLLLGGNAVREDPDPLALFNACCAMVLGVILRVAYHA